MKKLVDIIMGRYVAFCLTIYVDDYKSIESSSFVYIFHNGVISISTLWH